MSINTPQNKILFYRTPDPPPNRLKCILHIPPHPNVPKCRMEKDKIMKTIERSPSCQTDRQTDRQTELGRASKNQLDFLGDMSPY